MQNLFSHQLATEQALATRLLSSAWQSKRLLPAYLFCGRGMSVKWQLVKELASHLNCARVVSGSNRSCRVDLDSNWCVNCRWIDKDEHPQALKIVSGEGTKSGKIAVEKARELSEELGKGSKYYRVIVVEDAGQDSFHRPAANALLKTIEEPHPGILLIFFALTSDAVLPTVVSRCQTLELAGSTLAEEGIWSLCQNLKGNIDLRSGKFDCLIPLLNEVRSAHRKKGLLKSIALAEKLQEMLDDEELLFDELIDAVVALEFNALSPEFASSPQLTRYASELLRLSELAKTHNRQFVSRKAVLETLTFSWNELRTELKC